MDFNISNLWVIYIGGVEVWITETIFNTWIIMAGLIIFALIVRLRIKKFTDTPKGLQNVVEMMVEAFDNLVKVNAGEKLMSIGHWYFTVFIFILVSNLSGLLTLRPPTADWATTFALALSTFMLIHILGAHHRKGAYWKSFFEPFPLFFPINLIGELARPISLSFRLFGNILSGMILMTIVYTLPPIFVRFGIPVPLHAFFDVFSACLQTYIFSVLSLAFIGNMCAEE